MNKKYSLVYRILRKRPTVGLGTPGESIPTYDLYWFAENVESSVVLQRMKEIETEHRENVKHLRGFPQFAQFSPIKEIL